MKSSAPVILLFLISVGLAVTGLIGCFRPALLPPDVAQNKFWFVTGAWAVMSVGALIRS
jgi:hypothetical protein